jgi:hypothetical protein
MVQTVEQVTAEHSRADLQVSLVVPTLYRKTALADEILAKLHEYFPGRCAAPLAQARAGRSADECHKAQPWLETHERSSTFSTKGVKPGMANLAI